jgi:hypothetical protein
MRAGKITVWLSTELSFSCSLPSSEQFEEAKKMKISEPGQLTLNGLHTTIIIPHDKILAVQLLSLDEERP